MVMSLKRIRNDQQTLQEQRVANTESLKMFTRLQPSQMLQGPLTSGSYKDFHQTITALSLTNDRLSLLVARDSEALTLLKLAQSYEIVGSRDFKVPTDANIILNVNTVRKRNELYGQKIFEVTDDQNHPFVRILDFSEESDDKFFHARKDLNQLSTNSGVTCYTTPEGQNGARFVPDAKQKEQGIIPVVVKLSADSLEMMSAMVETNTCLLQILTIVVHRELRRYFGNAIHTGDGVAAWMNLSNQFNARSPQTLNFHLAYVYSTAMNQKSGESITEYKNRWDEEFRVIKENRDDARDFPDVDKLQLFTNGLLPIFKDVHQVDNMYKPISMFDDITIPYMSKERQLDLKKVTSSGFANFAPKFSVNQSEPSTANVCKMHGPGHSDAECRGQKKQDQQMQGKGHKHGNKSYKKGEGKSCNICKKLGRSDRAINSHDTSMHKCASCSMLGEHKCTNATLRGSAHTATASSLLETISLSDFQILAKKFQPQVTDANLNHFSYSASGSSVKMIAKDEFILDTGATNTLTNNIALIDNPCPSMLEIGTANKNEKATLHSQVQGTIGNGFPIHYIPELAQNLAAPSQIQGSNAVVIFNNKRWLLFDSNKIEEFVDQNKSSITLDGKKNEHNMCVLSSHDLQALVSTRRQKAHELSVEPNETSNVRDRKLRITDSNTISDFITTNSSAKETHKKVIAILGYSRDDEKKYRIYVKFDDQHVEELSVNEANKINMYRNNRQKELLPFFEWTPTLLSNLHDEEFLEKLLKHDTSPKNLISTQCLSPGRTGSTGENIVENDLTSASKIDSKLPLNEYKNNLVVMGSLDTEFDKLATSDSNINSVTKLMHLRNGHASLDMLQKICLQKNSKFSLDKNFLCISCKQADATRFQTLYSNNPHRCDVHGKLLRCDICGPITPIAYNGHRYFIAIVCDHCGETQVMTVESKDHDTIFPSIAKQLISAKCSIFYSDNEGALCCTKADNFYFDHHITHMTTIADISLANGAVDNRIQIINRKATAILTHSQMDKRYWPFAIKAVTFVMNRLPSTGNKDNKSAYELNPTHSYPYNTSRFKVLFCVVIMYDTEHVRGEKVEPKGKVGIFVGYPTHQIGYQIMELPTKKLFIRSQVRFLEDIFYNDLVALTNGRIGYSLHVYQRSDVIDEDIYELTDLSPLQSSLALNTHRISFIESDNDQMLLAHHADISVIPSSTSAFNVNKIDSKARYIPRSIADISHAEPEYQDEWRNAIVTEIKKLEDSATITWQRECDQVDTPGITLRGIPIFNLKKVLKNSSNDLLNIPGIDPIASTIYSLTAQMRLVAGGNMQVPGDGSFSNIHAPVVDFATVLLIIGMVALMPGMIIYNVDFQRAFLNGMLAEVIYLQIPLGIPKRFPDSVWRLWRSLYGLRQAGRNWYEALDKLIMSLGFKKSRYDPCLYWKRMKDNSTSLLDILWLLTHVDDLIIASSQLIWKQWLVGELSRMYKLTDLGVTVRLLGFTVQQCADCIKLSNDDLLATIVTRLNLTMILPATSPDPASDHLSRRLLTKIMNAKDKKNYQEILGLLVYAAYHWLHHMIRAVQQATQFMSEPREEDYNLLLCMGKYAKSQIGHPKIFRRSTTDIATQDIISFVDSSFCPNFRHDGKSITGGIIIYAGSSIVAVSSTQTRTAASAMEAEYVALSDFSANVLSMRNLMNEIGLRNPNSPCLIYEDNAAALKNASTMVISKASRYICLDVHKIKDYVDAGSIDVKDVATSDNVADILTKPGLNRDMFEDFADQMMGYKPIRGGRVIV